LQQSFQYSIRVHRGVPDQDQLCSLIEDGSDTGLTLPGHTLSFQAEARGVVVLVTQCGRAFDCSFAVSVFDKSRHRVVAQRIFVPPSGDAWLVGAACIASQLVLRFQLDTHDREHILLIVKYRDFSLPLIRPRIAFTRRAVGRASRGAIGLRQNGEDDESNPDADGASTKSFSSLKGIHPRAVSSNCLPCNSCRNDI
jgi:hypothetical protein